MRRRQKRPDQHWDEEDQQYWDDSVYHLDEYKSVLNFWRGLNPMGVRRLVEVTDDMPQDRHAGFMNLNMACWSKARYAGILMTVARMVLNWCTVSSMALIVLKEVMDPSIHSIVLVNDTGTVVQLNSSSLHLCEDGFMGNSTCISSQLRRLHAVEVISLCEGFVVSIMLLLCLLSGLAFLVSSNNASLPADRPFLFLILPKIVAKASSISFLQLLNFGRFSSLFFRREMKLWWYLAKWSLFTCAENRYVGESHVGEEEPDGGDWEHEDESKRGFSWFFGVVVYVGLVCMSAQAFLMKLTMMSYAALTSFDTWSLQQWIAAAGFMNQLAGLAWLEEVEMHRILLFKFGGPNAEWSHKEVFRCDCYFRFLAMAVTGGKIGKGGEYLKNRMKVLAVLYTMNADDIQKLSVSAEREEHIEKERVQRYEHFKELFADAQVDEFREALKTYGMNKDTMAKKDAAEILLHSDAWKNRIELLKKKVEVYTNFHPKPKLRLAKLADEQIDYLERSMALALNHTDLELEQEIASRTIPSRTYLSLLPNDEWGESSNEFSSDEESSLNDGELSSRSAASTPLRRSLRNSNSTLSISRQ